MLGKQIPSTITIEDTNLYEDYAYEFAPGQRVFWLTLLATVVKLAISPAPGMSAGFAVYEIILDPVDNRDAKSFAELGYSGGQHVEAFRGQLRPADDAAMHLLAV